MSQSPLKVQACPTCSNGGSSPPSGLVPTPDGKNWQQCPTCAGNGAVPMQNGFPVPYWYVFGPFNTAGQLTVIGQAGGAFQKQIADNADFETIFIMGRILQGDSRFVQLQLKDVGSNFTFSSDPVDFDNFCGSATLPLPILEPYTFGRFSQVILQIFPLVLPGQIQVIGNGDGATVTFSGILQTPVLPSFPANTPPAVNVTVTDLPGVIVGTDDGNGSITGAGITGVINYQTGAITVTYAVAPAIGTKISVAYTLGVAKTVLQVTLFGFLMVEKQGVGARPFGTRSYANVGAGSGQHS